MSPAAATVDLLTLLGFTIGVLGLAVAGVIWLERKLEYGCPSCSHCASRRKARADAELAAREEYERRWGLRPLDDDKEERRPPE